MDPLDTMKAMNELWGKGMQNFFSAQQNAFGAICRRDFNRVDDTGRPRLRVGP